MDKKIIDTLVKFGLITNIGVNADKYTSIDDLIAKGVVTIPGAKAKILELIGDINVGPVENTNEIVEPLTEVLVDNSPVIDETPEAEPVIDETPVSEPVIDETPESETVIVDDPVGNNAEIVVEEVIEPIVEEVADATPKSKKSKKN